MRAQKLERLFGTKAAGDSATPANGPRQTREDRVDRILEAASRQMARSGYEGASMRAIAGEAEVSLAGLYHYFESKERMLFLIQFRTFSALLANVREGLHGLVDPTDQLREIVRVHVSYFAANLAALKICSHELDSLTGPAYDEIHTLRHDYYELTRSVVDQIVAQYGVGSSINSHVATMNLFGMLNWLYRWYEPGKDRTPAGLANLISAQFLGGILGASDWLTRSSNGRRTA